MDQIEKAAELAGKWWADRLAEKYADKREIFAQEVAKRVDEALRGKVRWEWNDRKEGDGKPKEFVHTSIDYDPQGLLLEAVREVIEPQCRGYMFSADGIFPYKHSLAINPERLIPKEGYGNWTQEIVVE